MSNGVPVPATAVSRYYQGFAASRLVIGKQSYYPNGGRRDEPFYAFLVLDLTNLNVVQNVESKDPTAVPSQVSQYGGNPQYFLFAIGNYLTGSMVPQGNLYAFLKKVGSSNLLNRAEQIISQVGTGSILYFSYILAATMSEVDLPGFETFSENHSTILTMRFMPITVQGKTIYVPIQP